MIGTGKQCQVHSKGLNDEVPILAKRQLGSVKQDLAPVPDLTFTWAHSPVLLE